MGGLLLSQLVTSQGIGQWSFNPPFHLSLACMSQIIGVSHCKASISLHLPCFRVRQVHILRQNQRRDGSWFAHQQVLLLHYLQIGVI